MRKQNSDFQAGFVSEAGSQLKNNDYFGYVELDEYACYVIADGITDLPDTESARLAIETVILRFQENPSISRLAIRRLVTAANKALLECDSYKRSEASLTVVVTDYRRIRYAYLGNTRLRMYRGGRVYRQTADMSFSQELFDQEKIPKDALQRHEERNNLYDYLGKPYAKPFVSKKIKLQDTDILALYTRGIWENVDEAELDDVFSEAGKEVQPSLDSVEELLLSRQPENLDNYTFAVIFVNKVYSDPKRDKKRKKRIIITIIAVAVVAILIGVCIFLHWLKEKRTSDMNYYFTNTIEYINLGNFVRAQEECEKAGKLADKLRDEAMRDRTQEYLFVIETVQMADDCYQEGSYKEAREYYLSARDRARYADQIAEDYMEQKLQKIADIFAVEDYLSLGDTLKEQKEYERAEEKYLRAEKMAAQSQYDEGKEEAMAALEKLYEERAAAEEEQKEEAAAQAGKVTAAAELVAEGDKACVAGDYVGAKVYYTMALTQYQEMGDAVNQSYIEEKLDTVDVKLQEQQEKRDKAEMLEQQGDRAKSDGDLWTAKTQYLQAKNLYLELDSETDVERISAVVEQIDAMLQQQ